MIRFAAWEGAERCTEGPKPGTEALLAWCLDEFDQAFNLGIFNCRTVRGASTTSCHGEGRACDVGFALIGGKPNPAGTSLVRRLLKADPAALGIQAIIWSRTIYSAKSPDGRPYTGVAPHFDHVHIEQTRLGASRLNMPTIRKVMKERGGLPRVQLDRVQRAFRDGEPLPEANDIRQIQRRLQRRGYDIGADGVDGWPGKHTRRAYAAYQAKTYGVDPGHPDASGIPGEDSLTRLGFEVVT